MKQNMNDKKRSLAPGEIVQLCFDQAFKIMYGNQEHLEIITMLLSKILEIDYDDLEGKVTLLPLNVTNKTVGEKKSERDVVVSVKTDDKYRIVIEVNVKTDFYESVMDRNIYYSMSESKRLVEGETYDNMDITFLINFNTFFINKDRKKVLDEYLLRNEEGDILSKKYKVLNINIEECKELWYHNNYQGKFGLYEEDLVLLSAALMVEKESEFLEILDLVRMKPEIKDLMEGVLTDMNKDDDLVGSYYNWKEENDKMNRSIINEVERKSLKKGIEQGREEGIEQTKKEIVINMYNNKCSLELISKYTNLSIESIKTIINNEQNL